jgi:acetyl esterase/lipase
MIPVKFQFSSFAIIMAAALPMADLMRQPVPETIPYQQTAQGTLKLFYFKPAKADSRTLHPAAIWIHGGGWTGGNCESFFPMARYTAARGAASFVVEYRLVRTNGPTIEDSISDCRAAVRYVRSHAEKLGIHPCQIALIGESAGGHLAACAGLMPTDSSPVEDRVSARPDALVLYNPLTDFTRSGFARLITNSLPPGDALNKMRELSPLFHARPGHPPTLCIHGLADTIISPEQSRLFAEAMVKAGNRCDLVLLPDTPHAFLIPNYKCDEAVVVDALRRADDFLSSLGYFSGCPSLTISDPPAWEPKAKTAKQAR